MILKDSFANFLDKINLDQTRRDKIISAHNAVREFLEQDEEISKRYYETFLQGSYRLGTAVRPQGDGSYDVDVVLSLNLSDFHDWGILGLPSSDEVIQWIVKRLRQNPVYKDKVEGKKKCACINYAEGFHLDILPAHCSGNTEGILQIPPNWKQSHPKGFKLWCVEVHELYAQKFYPAVKMLKWWRNIHFGDDGSPRSILLTTIIGNHMSKFGETYDQALVNSMEKINTFLQANWLVPQVSNPSLITENLSASWAQSDYTMFKDKFKLATETARRALQEKDEGKTIELWNSPELFADTFPKTKHGVEAEAKAFAEALRAGQLFTTSNGLVVAQQRPNTVVVPSTRFFGSE